MKAIQKVSNNVIRTERPVTSMSLSGLKTAIQKSKAAARKTILLLDCSGSMARYTAADKRRIDILREALVGLRGDVTMIAFNSEPRQVSSIPEPSGGTAMHLAIQLAGQFLSRDGHDTKTILISDGEPDCEDSALQAAKSLPCKINTIFCGDEGSVGERFLRKIAALKDGQHNVVNWNSPIIIKKIENKVKGLLSG